MIQSTHLRFALAACALFFSSIPSLPVFASDKVIEELVVTARKRAESLQDVPIAVSALSGDDLEVQSATEFTDIAAQVPNVIITETQSDPSVARVVIRGQQQADTLLTTDASVGVYVDGVNLPRQTGLNANIFDIERIEILKGPQGTLYGKNTTGGAINIIAKKPELGVTNGFLRATAGNEAFTQISGGINIPLGERAAARIAVQKTDQDGFGESRVNGNELYDQDEIFVRGSLAWDISDNVDVLLQIDHMDLDEGGAMEKLLQPGGLVIDPTNTLPITPSLVAGLSSGLINPADIPSATMPIPGPTFVPGLVAGYNELLSHSQGSPFRNYADLETYTEATVSGVGLTFSWDINENTSLKSITGYREWESERLLDLDGSPYVILHPLLAVDADIWSQEFQVNYSAENSDWVFGVYYSQEEGVDGSKTLAVAPLNPTRNITDGTVENTSAGIYAQGTFHLTDLLDLTLGYRFTEEDKELVSRNRLEVAAVPGVVIACRVPPGNLPITACSNKLSDSFDDSSWLVSLDYDVSDNVMVYGSIARSWRGGGQNLRADTDSAAAAPFDPETATNYEIGLKGDFLDSTMRANIAVYFTDYEDIQRSIIVPGSASGSVVTTLTNAAEAEIFGAEAELWFAPSDALSFFATIGYTDFEYKEFNSLGTDGVTILDRSGEDAGFPDLTASVSARYDTELNGGNQLTVQLDYIWQDEFLINPTTTRPDVTTQDSYGRVNLRADLQFGDGYMFSLWGKNLTDEEFLITATDFTGNLGHTIGVVGRPRTYGLTISKEFGAD